MTANEAKARVLFYSGSRNSFISTSFTLHVDRELSPLKHKLVVVTPLGELIIRLLYSGVMKF